MTPTLGSREEAVTSVWRREQMHLSGFCSFFSKFRMFGERTRERNTDFLSRKGWWMAGRKHGHFLPSTPYLSHLHLFCEGCLLFVSLPWPLLLPHATPLHFSLSLSSIPDHKCCLGSKLYYMFQKELFSLCVMEPLWPEKCQPQSGSSVRPGSRVRFPRRPNGHRCEQQKRLDKGSIELTPP